MKTLHCETVPAGAIVLLMLVTALCVPAVSMGQFDSGSDGSDGALDFSGEPPGTIIDFDPRDFSPPLDPDGDGVYHFTTVNIPLDITVRLRANRVGAGPVRWLASGAVTVGGVLDLDGEDGSSALPTLSVPGPGGFSGGAKISSTVPNFFSGYGPGAGTGQHCNASHAIARNLGACTSSGGVYGNGFLLPLVGGSGGGGNTGGGGGAGGGAILIASSLSVTIDGSVTAIGGDGGGTGFGAGGGSGGAVRIVAPQVSGTGAIDVRGQSSGGDGNRGSSEGRIRIEASTNSFAGQFFGDTRVVTLVPDPVLLPPADAPSLSISSIDGVAAPAFPQGLFNPVDVTIDNAQAVDIVISAKNIPLGTVVNVTVVNETEGATSVTSTPLAGTLEASTATASVTIPAGFSQVFTDADWSP